MAGTNSEPIFVKDAQYVSIEAEEAITLGQVVKIDQTSGLLKVATEDDWPFGVAVGGDRFSRTQTDNQIAAGGKVTVCTRGIVRLTTDATAIVPGQYVETADDGEVRLAGTGGHTVGDEYGRVVGMALEANDSTDQTVIQVKLRML